MRAITIWQPWATLIIIGAKRFETRAWPAKEGPVAIHAAAKKDPDCLELCLKDPFRSALVMAGLEKVGDLPFGAVLGTAHIVRSARVECLRADLNYDERQFGDFSDGRYGWEMSNVVKFDEPIPERGKQKFWFWKPPQAVSSM